MNFDFPPWFFEEWDVISVLIGIVLNAWIALGSMGI